MVWSSPVATGGFGGLSPLTQTPRFSPIWNMKHYKSVEFLSKFGMLRPPGQTYSPIEEFLVLVWSEQDAFVWFFLLAVVSRIFKQLRFQYALTSTAHARLCNLHLDHQRLSMESFFRIWCVFFDLGKELCHFKHFFHRRILRDYLFELFLIYFRITTITVQQRISALCQKNHLANLDLFVLQ